MVDNIEDTVIFSFDFSIKLGILLCNFLSFILLDASSNLSAIERGGVIALLLIATVILWKLVKSKDRIIKESFEARIEDKDKEIQNLKDLLNRK